MGWNSWDCFGPSVTEAEVLANAEFMARHLKQFGWEYVVVDIQWYEPTARGGGYNAGAQLVLDDHGLPQPALNRFPSAAGGSGFRPLADFVHGLGLKLGVHIMRGIPRQAVDAKLPIRGTDATADQVADRVNVCSWCTDNYGLDHSHPGAQAYYDSLLAQFARWELDFVKADDMIGPFHAAEVEAFSRAVQGCGRPMVLSLSPGVDVTTAIAEPLAAAAQMWRISNDLWDDWKQLLAQFGRLATWAPYARAGAWPDADMLPIGHVGIRAEVGTDRTSNLSLDEQRTMMTLWCIARSPLMMGGDLPTTAPETIALLTNPEVLAVLNNSSGARQVLEADGVIAWTAQGEDGQAYVAVFNVADSARTVRLPWEQVGLQPPAHVRDLWTRADRRAEPELTVDLPAHGSAVFAVSS